MDQKPDTQNTPPEKESDDSTTRREFLRNSVYAVYATPLITLLLVENASAAAGSTGCTRSGNQPPSCP